MNKNKINNNMKQYTTEKQWNELSDKGQDELYERFSHSEYRCPYPNNPDIKGICVLSIGQMIEALKEKTEDDFINKDFINHIYIGFDGDGMQGCNSKISIGWDGERDEELCDALWREIKHKYK